MFADIHSGDYGSFDSDCSATMVGFVQSIPSITGEKYTLTEHKATCFFATQDKSLDLEHTESGQNQDVKFAKIVSHEMLAQREIKSSVNSEEEMEKLFNPDKIERPDTPPMTSS
jgi:hypothetical protein